MTVLTIVTLLASSRRGVLILFRSGRREQFLDFLLEGFKRKGAGNRDRRILGRRLLRGAHQDETGRTVESPGVRLIPILKDRLYMRGIPQTLPEQGLIETDGLGML